MFSRRKGNFTRRRKKRNSWFFFWKKAILLDYYWDDVDDDESWDLLISLNTAWQEYTSYTITQSYYFLELSLIFITLLTDLFLLLIVSIPFLCSASFIFMFIIIIVFSLFIRVFQLKSPPLNCFKNFELLNFDACFSEILFFWSFLLFPTVQESKPDNICYSFFPFSSKNLYTMYPPSHHHHHHHHDHSCFPQIFFFRETEREKRKICCSSFFLHHFTLTIFFLLCLVFLNFFSFHWLIVMFVICYDFYIKEKTYCLCLPPGILVNRAKMRVEKEK